MASIRFYKRIPLIPGVAYLNISKGGFSLTFGRHYGFTVTFGKHGIRITWGLSGTGLSISEQIPFNHSNDPEEDHLNDRPRLTVEELNGQTKIE